MDDIFVPMESMTDRQIMEETLERLRSFEVFMKRFGEAANSNPMLKMFVGRMGL